MWFGTDDVRWNAKVNKQLEKLPSYIREKFYFWVFNIGTLGLRNTRVISGFHDEPLKGNRSGQRSVRLNRSYRVIYVQMEDESSLYILVIEVNKHEY